MVGGVQVRGDEIAEFLGAGNGGLLLGFSDLGDMSVTSVLLGVGDVHKPFRWWEHAWRACAWDC
jgi:hypothetical protein